MLRDFKAFILRGSVVDLAIGVVIGAAFTSVVGAFTDGIINPLISLPGETPSLKGNAFEISGSVFQYGLLIDALIDFLIVAAVIYFFVVKPVNILMDRRKTEPEVDSTNRDCPECLSSIPVAARRCAFCTAEVGVAG